jgi:DNA-binding LacI/PurR family transcriptional regulator
MPSLTTLSQPLAEMGSMAVAMLVGNINNPKVEKQTRIFMPKLIIGGSTIKSVTVT